VSPSPQSFSLATLHQTRGLSIITVSRCDERIRDTPVPATQIAHVEKES